MHCVLIMSIIYHWKRDCWVHLDHKYTIYSSYLLTERYQSTPQMLSLVLCTLQITSVAPNTKISLKQSAGCILFTFTFMFVYFFAGYSTYRWHGFSWGPRPGSSLLPGAWWIAGYSRFSYAHGRTERNTRQGKTFMVSVKLAIWISQMKYLLFVNNKWQFNETVKFPSEVIHQ